MLLGWGCSLVTEWCMASVSDVLEPTIWPRKEWMVRCGGKKCILELEAQCRASVYHVWGAGFSLQALNQQKWIHVNTLYDTFSLFVNDVVSDGFYQFSWVQSILEAVFHKVIEKKITCTNVFNHANYLIGEVQTFSFSIIFIIV